MRLGKKQPFHIRYSHHLSSTFSSYKDRPCEKWIGIKHIGIRGISDVALENRQAMPGETIKEYYDQQPGHNHVSPITRRLTRREERDEEKLDRDFVRHYGSNLPEIQNLKRLGLFRRHLKMMAL